ncbi:zinc finger protein 239-like [Perca fluviatilis]|uniref:zinc finger protein 239-like n=1 Tax=Perca fluviatilis TaxID=8168 RepID=UPI0019667242|nr:zinc finger protein 239-like [Perca fluviatilis]
MYRLKTKPEEIFFCLHLSSEDNTWEPQDNLDCPDLITDMQSLRNESDEVKAHVQYQHEFKEACILALGETWLGEADSDAGIALDGFSAPVCMDRVAASIGKSRGGGVCLYINERWCKTTLRGKVDTRQVKGWSEEATLALQGCLDCTLWEEFVQSSRDIDELTEVVSSWVAYCEDTPYSCDQCGAAFTRQSTLIIHQRIHTGEKPYSCDQCGKKFSRSDSLEIHRRIHTGEKPYWCDLCGTAFSQSGHLESHRSVHTRDKPYSCEQCGAAFMYLNRLQSHRRVHTGEKPFWCEQCGKMFSQSRYLKRHQRIHTGEKPYWCEQCGKTFSQSTDLKKHQRIHTGEKPYWCEQCGKTFSQIGNLKSHQRVHTVSL